MTLLNGTAMFAAAAVLVPIIIHLRRRRKSKVIDWPAMQFLKSTVASRRRGLTLEHLVLLFVRCLSILLFTLAMARPVIEASRRHQWGLVLLLAVSGLLLLIIATLATRWTRRRRAGAVISALLLLGAAAGLLSIRPEALTDSNANRDIVIVIDQSLTMTIEADESSHFDLAISQARSLVKALSGDSTVSIVLAGPTTETVDGSPFRNLRKAEQILDTLTPVPGGSDLTSAITQARLLARKTPNTRKQIVLLTDDQMRTWEAIENSSLPSQIDKNTANIKPQQVTEARDESSDPPSPETQAEPVPEIAYAALISNLPKNTNNLSVDRVTAKSPIMTVARPVSIDVDIRNGGTETVGQFNVELLIDGQVIARQVHSPIEPGVNATISFVHAFRDAGQHVISGRVDNTDLLPEDNSRETVVNVTPHLSVLLVNGNTDVDRAQRSATFVQLALDPLSFRRAQPNLPDQVENSPDSTRSIVTTTIEAAGLVEVESLDSFHVVILCDVPRLPAAAAERLAAYVADGGGLWVIPHENADAGFYNRWKHPHTNERILPSDLLQLDRWEREERSNGRANHIGVSLDSSGRPFLDDLLQHEGHGLEHVSVLRFWQTTPSHSAIIGMRLTNNEPLFVESACGRGRVLMQNVALARRDSDLAATAGFPVLMHLWTYHLGDTYRNRASFDPTSDLVAELTSVDASYDNISSLTLVQPSGTTREVQLMRNDGSALACIGPAATPGVYRLSDRATKQDLLTFSISRDPNESDLTSAGDNRIRNASEQLGVTLIDHVDQLSTPNAVESTEQEIWSTLLFILLWMQAVECLLARWIHSRRTACADDARVMTRSSSYSSPTVQLELNAEEPVRQPGSPMISQLDPVGGSR